MYNWCLLPVIAKGYLGDWNESVKLTSMLFVFTIKVDINMVSLSDFNYTYSEGERGRKR